MFLHLPRFFFSLVRLLSVGVLSLGNKSGDIWKSGRVSVSTDCRSSFSGKALTSFSRVKSEDLPVLDLLIEKNPGLSR